LIKAIENAAPRDGVTVIEYGGASILKQLIYLQQKIDYDFEIYGSRKL
jgi:ribosomal protein S7